MQDVEKARAYLLQTATPGGTMSRQGAELAISRLNPTYVINLANSIQQARAEGINAGIYSSYRPPGLGVGGFTDKYLSLHSYGLAADITGIGTAGSKTAKRWYDIATANGLHNPYGYKNRREFNHYQAVPEKGEKFVPAHPALRRSIGSLSPKSLDQMWAAAGLGGASGALAYADTGGPAVPGGPPTLRKGATDAKTGGAVTRLQQQLAAAGKDPGPIDGKYGSQTEKAVRAVEQQYHLSQERPGKAAAGPQVQAALAGNERMRIVADTQQRFGGPLAPGVVPTGGLLSGMVGSPPPMGIGRTDAPTNVARGASRPAPPAGAEFIPPPPLVAQADRNRFDTEAMAGGRIPFPNIITDFPGYVKRSMEVAMPGGPGAPPVASIPPAPGYDTRGVSAGLSSPNVGAANALMQQVAARQAAAPPVSVPGRTGDAPAGINNFGDIADAWRRIGGDVAGLFGGPPTSTATPQTSVPQGFAPIPPAVPESASPAPSTYNRWGRQISGGPPFAPTSLGGDLSRLGTPGERAEDVPGEAVAYAGPPAANDNPGLKFGGVLSIPLPFVTPFGRPGGTYIIDRSKMNDNSGGKWNRPNVLPFGPTSNLEGLPTSLGGDLSRLGTPGERAEDVPGVAVGGSPLVVPSAQPDIGRPYSQSNFSDRFSPGLTDASSLLPGGMQFQASGAELPAAGDEPAAAPGGVPSSDFERGNPYFAGGRGPMAVAPIGTQYVGAPPQAPRPIGSRIATGMISAGANALVPGLGFLAQLIGNSASRGSFDNAQAYRGPIQGRNYATAAPNPYGGYTTGSSYSASPFTPSGAGWTAPNFSPVSGGALYSYNPETHTYVDSQGRTHSYD